MPEIVADALDSERATRLRTWLKKPEFRLFLEVIQNQARLHMEEALAEALKVDSDQGASLLAVNSMKQAKKYADAVAIIESLAKPDSKFNTLKLK